jgi:tetratricopeptide (TPR) repeat protein
MTTPGRPLPLDAELDRLLSEAFRHLKLERYDDAAAILTTVKAQAPAHPAVLEFEGDLAFARRRYREARDCYRAARELDPTDPRLEEKFATAVLKVFEPQLIASMPLKDPDDFEVAWGERRARPPAASASLSLLFPGAGQLYNGELIKGWLLVAVGAGLWTTLFYTWSYNIIKHLPSDFGAVLGGMFHGRYAVFTVFAVLAWLYSIVDAAVIAYQETEAIRQQQMQARMDELMAKRARKKE